MGGDEGGYTLYVKDKKLIYDFNYYSYDHYTLTSDADVPTGPVQLKMDFKYDGGGPGKGGTATLYINGQKAGEGRIEAKNRAMGSCNAAYRAIGTDPAGRRQDPAESAAGGGHGRVEAVEIPSTPAWFDLTTGGGDEDHDAATEAGSSVHLQDSLCFLLQSSLVAPGNLANHR